MIMILMMIATVIMTSHLYPLLVLLPTDRLSWTPGAPSPLVVKPGEDDDNHNHDHRYTHHYHDHHHTHHYHDYPSMVCQVSVKIYFHCNILYDQPMHCTMCTCGTKLSAGLNKLGHILKCLFYYFIQHIFVPSRSVRRNMGKFQFS